LALILTALFIIAAGRWTITNNSESLKRVYSFRLFSRGHFQVINANTKAMHFLESGISNRNLEELETGYSHLETSLGFIRSLQSELEIAHLKNDLQGLQPRYEELIAKYETMLDRPINKGDIKIKDEIITSLIDLNQQFGFAESEFWKTRAYDFDKIRQRNELIITIYWVVVVSIVISLALIIYFSIERTKLEEELEIQRIQTVSNSRLAALGQFSASVAHEINNPLTVILWRLKSLKKKFNIDQTDQKLKKEIESIEINSLRIDKIIKGIKTLSKNTESDKYEKISVKEIGEQLEDILAPKVELLELEYSFESSCPDAEILVKEVQLIQVLVNLINNSVDAIESLTHKWIHINSYVEKSQVVFTITDSGDGIPKKIRSQLFELFFTTKSKDNKGTGIGLAMAAQIIKDHNGSLVYNPKSQNTQFVISIPVV
jgi:signal transduction histidine kinase